MQTRRTHLFLLISLPPKSLVCLSELTAALAVAVVLMAAALELDDTFGAVSRAMVVTVRVREGAARAWRMTREANMVV